MGGRQPINGFLGEGDNGGRVGCLSPLLFSRSWTMVVCLATTFPVSSCPPAPYDVYMAPCVAVVAGRTLASAFGVMEVLPAFLCHACLYEAVDIDWTGWLVWCVPIGSVGSGRRARSRQPARAAYRRALTSPVE